ncbi:(Fe-S)-binding protein [Pseudothermotoga sp.]|nr:(Fe-S)-binding protein [Pseudothermotoga sp.]
MNHSANLNTEKNLIEFEAPSIDLHKKFSSKFSKVYVDEKAVQQVLKSLGKDDMKKQLNCGACGYESCKDKAVAVVLGKAEKEMCITYLVDKLKAATNRVVEESPNAIFIYKGNCLIYKNKAAEKLFLDTANLISLLNEIKIFSNRIYEIPDKGFFFVKSFTLPEDSGEVLLLVDMTKEKLQEERLKEIKHETLNKIEEMLARQMRIAQEIAGLLGESIAETKSRFVELRKFMEE